MVSVDPLTDEFRLHSAFESDPITQMTFRAFFHSRGNFAEKILFFRLTTDSPLPAIAQSTGSLQRYLGFRKDEWSSANHEVTPRGNRSMSTWSLWPDNWTDARPISPWLCSRRQCDILPTSLLGSGGVSSPSTKSLGFEYSTWEALITFGHDVGY